MKFDKMLQFAKKFWAPILGVVVFALFFSFVPVHVLAQAGDLGVISDQTGLTTESPLLIVARIIRVILGLLGILLVCLIIYAGVLWMTAGGNTEKVQKAKRILINAVIGLFIILASVAITTFIMSALSRATGSNVGGGSGSGGGGGSLGGGGGASSFTVARATEGDYAIYNILPQVQFSRNYDPDTIQNSVQLFNADTSEQVAVNIQRSNPYQADAPNSDSILYLVPDTTCPSPNEDVFCLSQNTNYRLTVLEGVIKSSTGASLVCSSVFAPCEFDFSTGDLLDLTRPTAEFEAPDAGARVPANTLELVQVVGTDDSGINSASVTSDGDEITGVAITQIDDENYLIETGEWNTGSEENVNIQLEATVTDVAGNVGIVRRSVRVAPAHCFNGLLDADDGETGVDCGGDCGSCTGNACTENSECSSGVCLNEICVAPPKITGMNPEGGGWGTYVLITGERLSNSGTVYFTGADGLIEALRPACAAGIEGFGILAEVPEGANDGPIVFELPSGLSDATNDDYGDFVPGEGSANVGIFDVNDVRRPNLCNASPYTGTAGTAVSLTGTEFASDDETDPQGDGRVDFERLRGQCSDGGGTCFLDSDCAEEAVCQDKDLSGVVYTSTPAENYEDWNDQLVRFLLDAALPDGDYFVRVTQDAQSSNPLPFFIRTRDVDSGSYATSPQISSISHDSGAIGDYLTIRGSNFGNSGQVFFDSSSTNGQALGDDNFPTQCSADALWTNSQVIIRVPAKYANLDTNNDILFETHDLYLQRSDDGASSNSVNFTIRDQAARPGLCAINPSSADFGEEVALIGGNLPTNDEGAKVVFTPELAVSNADGGPAVSWTSESRAITNVPENASNGQVLVETSEGVRSNSVDLNIQSSDNVDLIDTEISHFGWTFTTGVIPPKPSLIVACDTENGIYSALPNSQFNDEVCRNVNVLAYFTQSISEWSADGNPLYSIAECKNVNCSRVEDLPVELVRVLGNAGIQFAISPDVDAEGYEIQDGTVLFKPNTEYLVTLSGDIKASNGEALGEDVSWRFRVGDQSNICDVEEVTIQPSEKVFESLNDDSDFVAFPLAQECVPLSDELTYTWQHPANVTSRAECDPSMSSCLNLTSLSEGTGQLRTTVGDGISDTADIQVKLKDYYVERVYPDCGSACRNSDVRIVFSRPVDSSCSSSACIAANGADSGAADSLLAGMELRLCDDDECNTSQLIDTRKFCKVEEDGGCKEYSLEFDGLLEANAKYEVLVYADVFSVDGQQLTRLNGPFVYGSEFNTSDKICSPSAISLRPASATANSTEDYQAFIAEARSEPDTCSEVGQILDSKDLNWEWNPIATETFEGEDVKLADYFVQGSSLLDSGVDALCAASLLQGEPISSCENYEAQSNIGPLQVLEITDDAPKLVDKDTKSAEAVVVATAAEAIEDVDGSATYKLLCSATSDAQCPSDQGVGENGCCSVRPVLVGSDPANGQSNVCRNKLFELEFNTKMNEASIRNGVDILFGEGIDECPSGYDLVSADTGRPVGMFARIFRSIVPFTFAQQATECQLPIDRISQIVDADGHSHIRLFTSELLASGAEYEIRISDSVKSSLGVSANQGQVIFTSGSEICLVDEVKVSDPQADVEGFFSAANDSRDFQATALSYSGGVPQSIQPIAGVYSWDWQGWEETGIDAETSEDADLVAIDNETAADDMSDAQVTSGTQAGEGYVFSSLVIDDATGIDKDGRKVYGNLPIRTFFCEAPWPSIEAFPFVDGIAYGEDDATALTGAIKGDAWTHFSTMYCKDNGLEKTVTNSDTGRQEKVSYDLPGLNLTLASDRPEGIGVLKEYLFNVQGTQDLIAVRVLSNPEYLTPMQWYQGQGFTGSPDVTTVDGFPALKEGRSVYVFAPNQAALIDSENINDQILNANIAVYPNVYIISYNQSAEPATRAIWDQIVKNFKLAVNVRDERVCSLANDDGIFATCSSDFDCSGDGNVCLSDKLKLQRDAQRIVDVIDIARKAQGAGAPRLNAGTFVAGMTTSAWPSWGTTFANAVGSVPVDPVNAFENCPDGSDPATCFNEESRQFVCTEDDLVYRYKIAPLGDFEVSARLEYPERGWGYGLPADIADSVSLQRQIGPGYISLGSVSVPVGYETLPGFSTFAHVCTGSVIGDSAVCGDGIVGGEEVCEPGLPSGFEACTVDGQSGQRALGCASDCTATISIESNTCVPQKCSNGILDPGEVCDDGANNGQYGFCGTQCNYEPGFGGAAFCGDGVLNAGEACDCGAVGLAGASSGVDLAGNTCVVKNGQYSSNRSQTCSWDCRGPAVGFCGNGVVETASGEECDGVETRDAGTGRVCVAGDPEVIGQLCNQNYQCNTQVEFGVQPNDGICSSEEVPLVERRACSAPGTQNACKFDGPWGAPQAANDCGNGQLEEGEECDDGNDNSNDSCTNLCTLNVCGDGIVNVGLEGCDAGAENGQKCSAAYGGTCSYCSATCNTQVVSGAYCGDGQLQPTFETCDPTSDAGIYQWIASGGSIVDGYCSPAEKGLTKNSFFSGLGVNGVEYSGNFDFECSAVGVCEGGSNDGLTCAYEGGTSFSRTCGAGGTCVAPKCSQSCSLACPLEYSNSVVQFRANLEGSQRSGSINLSNLNDDTNFSPGNSPRRAEVYIPACTVAEGLVGDVSYQSRETEDLLLTFVLDFSGSMYDMMNGERKYKLLLENTRNAVSQLFEELGDQVSIQFVIYGPPKESKIADANISALTFADYKDWDVRGGSDLVAQSIYGYSSTGFTNDQGGVNETHIGGDLNDAGDATKYGVWYSGRYEEDDEDSVLTLLTTLENIPNSPLNGSTPTASGMAVASELLYDEYEALGEAERNLTRQVIVLMTDGGYNKGQNPSLAACRAGRDLEQEIFTVSVLDSPQSSFASKVYDYGPDGLLYQDAGGTDACNSMFDNQDNFINGTTKPRASFLPVEDGYTCNTLMIANSVNVSSGLDDEDVVNDLMACMSSGNINPETFIDYAHTASDSTEFAAAFENVVNSITGALFNYVGSSESYGLEEGANVAIPLPADFVCSDKEQVVPIAVSFSGEGSIQISNVRFNYCPF